MAERETADFGSVEELIEGRQGESLHVECGRETGERARAAVQRVYASRRCAFCLESDRGFDRDTVRSYLAFFARLAGGAVTAKEAAAHFGLSSCLRTAVRKLTAEQRQLMNFARASLFEPEVVFCERPLMELGPEARDVFLQWVATEVERGTVFVTVSEPLREALLMPGAAWWEEEGRLFPAQVDVEGAGAPAGSGEPAFEGDEVRVVKVQAKSGAATLLFDPREIDFVESLNRTNYVSVRGQLYQTPSTLEELEAELERFGFFRCHRSYIVNVQKVAKVERFTRNSFNLTLSDVAHSSIPLAKGRAEEMRVRYGWR